MAVAAALEGTLTTGTTWRALQRYLRTSGRAGEYNRFVARQVPNLIQTQLALLNQQSFHNQWLRDLALLFAGSSAAGVNDIAEWVVDTELWPQRRQDVIAALKVHQAAGEHLIIASGTYQPVVAAFARRLNAKAAGTVLELREGRLTGNLAHAINTGTTKAERLHEQLGYARLYAAYGDSEADIPMLMLSDKPVAVYPDRVLREQANALGWTVLE